MQPVFIETEALTKIWIQAKVRPYIRRVPSPRFNLRDPRLFPRLRQIRDRRTKPTFLDSSASSSAAVCSRHCYSSDACCPFESLNLRWKSRLTETGLLERATGVLKESLEVHDTVEVNPSSEEIGILGNVSCVTAQLELIPEQRLSTGTVQSISFLHALEHDRRRRSGLFPIAVDDRPLGIDLAIVYA